MRSLRKYLLFLLTLFFVMLGAAMPELASRIQDAKIGRLQQKLELSTVDLTLRQESDMGPFLRLISQSCTEVLWEEETSMSDKDACAAAKAVVEEMAPYELFPREMLDYLSAAEGDAEPKMLIAEDGSSILVWDCSWELKKRYYCSITVDDISGKLIRALIHRPLTDSTISWKEEAFKQMERWCSFIQDYYDLKLIDIYEDPNGTDGGLPYLFDMRFALEDEFYDLSLEMLGEPVLFNYSHSG